MEAGQGNVILTSSDDVTFTVSRGAARLSGLVDSVCAIAEEDGDPMPVPLPNVSSQILKKVIAFCEHHVEEPMAEIPMPLTSPKIDDAVQEWYTAFVDVELEELFEIIQAANYMNIKPLRDLTCATVATFVKGKTPEEIRAKFNITDEPSPEELEQVRRDQAALGEDA